MRSIKTCAILQSKLIAAMLFLLTMSEAYSQPKYEITISDITYVNVHKNWLFVPVAADLRVKWAVSVHEKTDTSERESYLDPKVLPLTYRVSMVEEVADAPPVTKEIKNSDMVDFLNVRVGNKFAFKVCAYDTNSRAMIESETASIVVGKSDPDKANPRSGKSWLNYLHPGRWQLATVGKSEIYDKSTLLGKIAFLFLSVTGFLSLVVWFFYSSRTLYLGNVFPYQRSTRKLFWSLSGSCDSSYEKRLTHKFKFVLNAWAMIAAKSREATVKAVKNIPQGLSSTEKMASVDVACMEYWTSDGDKAIGTIENIISFPHNHEDNSKKKADDLLAELVIQIEDSFHDLIEDSNGEAKQMTIKKQEMETLINEIYEPVVVDEKPFSRLRKWVLRKGVFDMQKGLRPFPTSRIIKAGLEIHRMNGHRWLKPTEEVKRAFEDRASNEIETLKKKSKIEWFWNYGTLAPLVGLFGTVTGITYAFQQLSKTAGSPDFVNTIQHLSNGIFEALWTTIFGLANGICFVIVYYYYKQKLDWIYSKWEEIYISITEKL